MELILATLASLVIEFISATGYLGITILMALESACIPIPSEVIMPFSGFLVFEGELIFWQVILWGTIGNLLGSILAYLVGLSGGRSLIEKYGKYFLISSSDLARADHWFAKYGQVTVLLSRVLPVVRTFISLPAGIARMNFFKFSLYTFLGSLPWAFVLTYAGLIMGKNWSQLESYFREFDLIIGFLIILGIIWWIWRHFKSKNN